MHIIDSFNKGQIVSRNQEVGMVTDSQRHVFTVLWASGRAEYFEQGHSAAGILRDITGQLSALSASLPHVPNVSEVA